MYRFIVLLLLPALLLTGCARAEEDSYIQIIVPEEGGYRSEVTPRPAAPATAPTAAPITAPTETPDASTPQPTAVPTAAPQATASPAPTAKPTSSPAPTPTAAPTTAPTAAPAASDDYNGGILELVNGARQQAGLGALKYSGRLQNAADIRAREIATLFEHTRPNGENCSTAVTDDGISFSAFGENIFMCSGVRSVTSELIFDAWMDSPSHRENILREGFTDMCIGVYSADGATYAVQLFGAGLS